MLVVVEVSSETPQLTLTVSAETSVEIQRVDGIDLDGTMTLTLTIIMVWKDPRLIFLNIKDNGLADGDENIKDISLTKQEQLWLPLNKIVHTNAVIGRVVNFRSQVKSLGGLT